MIDLVKRKYDNKAQKYEYVNFLIDQAVYYFAVLFSKKKCSRNRKIFMAKRLNWMYNKN